MENKNIRNNICENFANGVLQTFVFVTVFSFVACERHQNCNKVPAPPKNIRVTKSATTNYVKVDFDYNDTLFPFVVIFYNTTNDFKFAINYGEYHIVIDPSLEKKFIFLKQEHIIFSRSILLS